MSRLIKLRMPLFMLMMGLISWVEPLSAQWTSLNTSWGKQIRCMVKKGSALVAGTDSAGVYISANSDQNWVQSINGLSNLRVYSLATNGTSIAAGTYGGGVYVSQNSGSSWSASNSGLTLPFVYALTFSGTNMLAGTGGAGVFLSSNGGTSWTNVLSSSFIVNTFFIGDTYVLLGIGPYVQRSTNSGAGWANVVTSNTTIKAFAVTPRLPSGTNLFVGSLHGMFLSTDNGVNWATINGGLTFRNVNALATVGSAVFAATENGGVFRTTNNGTTWTEINTGLPSGTSARALVVDATYLYTGTAAGVVWRRSLSEITSVERRTEVVPDAYLLEQNYPNPFNPSTKVRFSVRTGPAPASLKVYNLLGQEIATLVSQQLDAGAYEVTFDASGLVSGVYYYRLQAGEFSETKRMVLLR